MTRSLVYRRLRAPRADRSFLLEPAWQACLHLASSNSQLLDAYEFDLHGRSFQSLRMSTRKVLLEKAVEHSRGYLDIQELQPRNDAPCIVSGHQPTLFHPGVWAKNFAIDRIASEVNGHAIQIVIDNDVMRSHAVLCPAGSLDDPIRVAEPFDRYQAAIPFEMRMVQDPELFRSFAERVAKQVKPFVAEPLITKLWPEACKAALEQGLPIGQAFAQARHRLERSWGTRTLEVPLSQLCETNQFRWFAMHLFLRGQEVLDSYNTRLQQYRNVHRLRNHAQPLPDLKTRDDWIEAPFWIWTAENPLREAAWLRLSGDDLEIAAGDNTWRLDHAAKNPEAAVEQLGQLSAGGGLRLRPRALANTMFLRLFCADTFLHGIGGAKYDQVTDLIIGDLFDVDPPTYGVLSLTALLPSPAPLLEAREIIHKRVQIREMYFHPERFLEDEKLRQAQVSSKVKTKQKLLRQKPMAGSCAAGICHLKA